MRIIKGKIIKHDSIISFNIDDKKKDAIINRILIYYKDYCHTGESIHQDDDSIIEAPSVLSDICDKIIKFKEE